MLPASSNNLKYIITILFFSFLSNLFAKDSNPISIKEVDFYPASDLIIDNNGNNTFLLKHNWADDSETIISYKSGTESAIQFNNLRILDYYYSNDLLYIITKENTLNKLLVIDKEPKIINELVLSVNNIIYDEAEILEKGINFVLRLDENLMFINVFDNTLSYKIIDNSVKIIENKNTYDDIIYYLQEIEGLSYLCKYNINSNLRQRVIVENAANSKIIAGLNKTVLLLNHEQTDESLVQIFNNFDLSLDAGFWIESKLQVIDVILSEDELYFSYIYNHSGKISINYGNEQEIQNSNERSIELSHSIIEPLAIYCNNDTIISVFKNSVMLHDIEFNELAFDFISISSNAKNLKIIKIQDKIALSDSQGTLLFATEYNRFWRFHYYYEFILKYIIPIILSILLFIILQMYRHTKRVHRELLNLPSAGIIMEFDYVGRLLRANKAALELINFNKNVPTRKLFSYYLNHGHLKPFSEMIDNTLKTKENKTSNISLIELGNKRELKCSVIVLKNLAGMFRGLVFTAIDITEQLERKRLTNWAQLAHDMQTNLSTIKLNAEHIESEEHTDIYSRRKKILHQVNVLMQRVRDIVTVGRNDVLELSEVSSGELILSARNEFDDTIFPNVNFKMVTDNFLISCDRPKLIRAIRNAIENAIKALPDKSGNLTISCYKDKNNAYFSIKDDGIGMNEDVKQKMMQPYFTTGERSGGFGIGTMIMQHVAELHNGRIDIKSEKNNGTEIIFIIPLNRK